MAPRWRYLANELLIGLRRNLLMTVATVVTVTVSLALLGAGLLVQRQVDKSRDIFYSQVEVSIYLLDNISEPQRDSLQSDLVANPVVEEVLYESKEQAYEHFRQIFEGDENVLATVTPESLPASFRVKLTDPEQFAVIQSQFSTYPGVDEVDDQKEVLNKFFNIMDAFRNGAIVVALLQLIAAAALISNTIRITAFARREQTAIMKLVGATNWYIRLPFIMEGVVAGVGGAVAAGALLVVAQTTLIESIRSQLDFVPFITMSEVLGVIPVLILIGALISSAASFLSLRRFLAV